MKRSNERTMRAAMLSLAAVPAAPAIMVLGLFAAHAASYDGTCGPYAPDIPAFACGWSEYLIGFFDPFSAVALIALSIALALATAAALALGWIAWALVLAVRSIARARRSCDDAPP